MLRIIMLAGLFMVPGCSLEDASLRAGEGGVDLAAGCQRHGGGFNPISGACTLPEFSPARTCAPEGILPGIGHGASTRCF